MGLHESIGDENVLSGYKVGAELLFVAGAVVVGFAASNARTPADVANCELKLTDQAQEVVAVPKECSDFTDNLTLIVPKPGSNGTAKWVLPPESDFAKRFADVHHQDVMNGVKEALFVAPATGFSAGAYLMYLGYVRNKKESEAGANKESEPDTDLF